MRDTDTIVNLFATRERHQQPIMAKRLETLEVYENDADVPLPELDKNERPAVPNLLQQGVDQLATRVASTMPIPVFTPTKETKTAQDRASKQRQTITEWWDESAQELILPERARHFLAYGLSPVMIRPDKHTKMPKWHVRSALGCYPAPSGRSQDLQPPDCIFAFQRSWAWLQAGGYADRARTLTHPSDTKPDDLFDLLEFVDDEHIVLVALGRHKDGYPSVGVQRAVELERLDNRAGQCTAVVPGRITLGAPMGQFDGIIGMYHLQAMLMALEVIAAKKGVFPDLWWVGQNGSLPQVVERADGMRGKHGKVTDATPFERQPQPGFQTNPTIDRIERAQRLTGGIPQELGGESTSNVRTGRRGDAVLSAAIDYKILEAQKIFARSLMTENRVAIAVAKGYWPEKYETLFDGDFQHHVKYSMAGADVNNLVISGGQRVGLGTLSKEGFREIDPLVEDPELEKDRVTAEAVRDAFLSSIQQLGANPEGPWQPAQFARLEELLLSNKQELYEAVMTVHAEMQEAQATQVPATDPAAQPGLSAPGQGMEQPAIAPPEEALTNLAQLMGGLGKPAQIGGRVA